jgi:hypothetical protein
VNSKIPKKGAVTGLHFGANVTIKNASITGRGKMRLDAKSQGDFQNCLFAFDAGFMHIRAQSPNGVAKFKDCFFTANFKMEWGAGRPFTKMPFDQWSQQNSNLAFSCKTIEMNLNQSLNNGEIPENIEPGIGCNQELLKRYIDFLPKRQALLDQAKKVVFVE